MSSPLESPEFENLFVGNASDDDGRVIDSLVQEVDAPATPVIERITPAPLIEPKRTTRLLSGTQTFDNLNPPTAPLMILPADANRVDLTIKGFSYVTVPTATDFVFVADSNGNMSSLSAGQLRSTSADFDLSEHTGPVWVFPSAALTGKFEISWWATTS
jgi:hypothetical protein